ncbi:hypothetical protein E2C01_054042 [Portunus trituberculatus]|uniref:Uncharacterized protein n=1 Tax=Portunus trituberculatus TaxID=210409 RepID=A0A5B7GS40_PORTR|nr:hypothetical protein [Portunus trituberculatus]
MVTRKAWRGVDGPEHQPKSNLETTNLDRHRFCFGIVRFCPFHSRRSPLSHCGHFSLPAEKYNLKPRHLNAAEWPDQSGSCVKYPRPSAAAWQCGAFWIKLSLKS